MASPTYACVSDAENLATLGWLVLEVGEGYEKVFESVVRGAPEILPGKVLKSLDKSGKLPFPSSQHHPLIRALRRDVFRSAAPTVLEAVGRVGLDMTGIAMTPDALLFRTQDTKQDPAKHWHRDSTASRGVFFGGWVNMGKKEEYFRMVPKSHLEGGKLIEVPAKGFVRTKESPSCFETVTIAPGHMLLFFERLHHTIMDLPAQRLFIGFQVDHVGAPSPCLGLMEALRNQAVLPIKSGQILPLVPKHQFMYTKTNKASAKAWANQNLSPEVSARVEDWLKGKMSQPFCPSLQDLGKAFEAYSEDEAGIFFLSELKKQEQGRGEKRKRKEDRDEAEETAPASRSSEAWEAFKLDATAKIAALAKARADEQILGNPSQVTLPAEGVLTFGSGQKLPFAHLSNFTAASPFKFGAHTWDTSEHAYQACVCVEEKDHHKLATGSPLSDLAQGTAAVFGKDHEKKARYWGPKRQKTGDKRSMLGIVAKMAIKEDKAQKLGLALRRKPEYYTEHVTSLFLDILKAKYEGDAALRDTLTQATGNAYLLEFDRGAERKSKQAAASQNANQLSRWAGIVKGHELWGINLQGEIQMALR